MNRSDEFPHEWVPLKMHAAHHLGGGIAFIDLGECNPGHEWQLAGEVAPSVRLCKIAPGIHESGKPNHFNGRNSKCFDLDDFQLNLR